MKNNHLQLVKPATTTATDFLSLLLSSAETTKQSAVDVQDAAVNEELRSKHTFHGLLSPSLPLLHPDLLVSLLTPPPPPPLGLFPALQLGSSGRFPSAVWSSAAGLL